MARQPFEFEGVVRLTRIGAGYLLFTFLVGFAALNTGNNSLYIALSAMLGTLLLSGMASKDGLKRIEVEVADLGETWAGRPAQGMLRVKNNSRIWTVRDLLITSTHLAEPVYVPVIERRSAVDAAATFRFESRGRVKLQRVDLYTRFPFALFTKKRRARLSGDTLVFPRLFDDLVFGEQFSSMTGDRSQRHAAGSGTEVFAFREYVRGDSLRHVHWKKSASLGRWIMKQQQQDANPLVVVVFDPLLPPGTTKEQFEELVSQAATWVHEALARDYEVRFHLVRQVLSASGRDGGRPVYEWLALVEPVAEAPAPHGGEDVVLFSLRSRMNEAKSA